MIKQEHRPRLDKLEEKIRLGASEKRIIEAHARGANENMKGVLTGVLCTIPISLLAAGAWWYLSKESSTEVNAGVDNDDGSDDDWQYAVEGSSVEQLEFAMAKLRKIKL